MLCAMLRIIVPRFLHSWCIFLKGTSPIQDMLVDIERLIQIDIDDTLASFSILKDMSASAVYMVYEVPTSISHY